MITDCLLLRMFKCQMLLMASQADLQNSFVGILGRYVHINHCRYLMQATGSVLMHSWKDPTGKVLLLIMLQALWRGRSFFLMKVMNAL
uniref:Uncharacterized protein n=1 Tax=Arundo donax TaxID=35708 RepID=A0A0A9EA89_ARUDO